MRKTALNNVLSLAGDGGVGSEEVSRQLADVLGQYLDFFPAEAGRFEQLQEQLRGGQNLLSRSNMSGHVTTSATVLNAAGTRVLFIFHKIFRLWLPPGGHYEPPGSLWGSAQREVCEETGLSIVSPHPWAAGRLIPVDIDSHEIAANPEKNEGSHLHHDFRFLGLASEDEALTPQLNEVLEARWVPMAEFRNSPNFRVRALHRKLFGMGLVAE
jgi:8-oxo-dGTP pyrophosphatase MutT (NUDIX family)